MKWKACRHAAVRAWGSRPALGFRHHNLYFSMSFHSEVEGLQGKARHSCVALWVASWASEMFPWMTMRMQGTAFRVPVTEHSP